MSVPPGSGQPYPNPPHPGWGGNQPASAPPAWGTQLVANEPWEPQPDRGPGVPVPFAAPPTERDSKRLWITLGVAGLLVILCVVGAVGGLGYVVATSRGSASQATDRVNSYLNALQNRDYPTAYDQLCADLRKQRTEAQFEREQRSQPDISSYQIGTAEPTDSGGYTVPAQVELASSERVNATFGLVLDGPGDLRICSISG